MKKIFNLFSTNTHRCVSSYTSGLLSQNNEPLEKDLKEFLKAASKGDLTKLKRLDIKMDIAQLNKQTSDAFHVASARGHAEVVRFLLQRQAEVNIYDNRKRSALMKAVQGQHEQCVKVLLEHGAQPDMKDIGGNTALHCAAKNPPISIAVLLLRHKADVNIQNKKGFTPLTVAVRDNHIKMVEFLLKQSANVNITDQDRKSPLMIAASKGQMHMLQLLMHFNADVTLTDIKGWSAHDYALKNGFFRCLSLLTKQEDGEINQYENKPQLIEQHEKIPTKREETLKHCIEESDPEDASQSETVNEFSESSEECWNSSENDEVEISQNTHPCELSHSASNNLVDKDKNLRGSDNDLAVLNKYVRDDGQKNPFRLGSTNDQDGKADIDDGQNSLVEVAEFSDWDSTSSTTNIEIKPQEKVIDSMSNNDRPNKLKTELCVGSDAELSDWDSPSRTSLDDKHEITGKETDDALGVLSKHENNKDQKSHVDVEKLLSFWDTLETSNLNDNVKEKPMKSLNMSRSLLCHERKIKSQQPAAIKKSKRASGQFRLPPHQKSNGRKQEGQTVVEALVLEQFNVGINSSLEVKVNTLMSQLAEMNTHLENERQNRETLEEQLVSTCTQLAAAVKETERHLAAQADAEKTLVQEKEEHQLLKDSLVHSGQSEWEERVKLLEMKNNNLTSEAAVLQARIFKLEEEKNETEANLRHLADSLVKLQVNESSTEVSAFNDLEDEETREIQLIKITEKVKEIIQKNKPPNIHPERGTNHPKRTFEGNKTQKIKQMKDDMEILEEDNSRFGTNLAIADYGSLMMDDQQSFKDNLSMPHLVCEGTDRRKKLDDYFKRLPEGDAPVDVITSNCKDLEEEMTCLLELMDKAKNAVGECKDHDLQTNGHTYCLDSPIDGEDKSRAIKQLEEAVEKLTRKKSRLSEAGLGKGKCQQKTNFGDKEKNLVQEMEGTSDLYREVKGTRNVSRVKDEDVVFFRNSRSVDMRHSLLTECGCRAMTDKIDCLSQRKMERAVSRCSQLEKANRELKDQLDTLKTHFCSDKFQLYQRENVPMQQNQRAPCGFHDEKWACQQIQYNLEQTEPKDQVNNKKALVQKNDITVTKELEQKIQRLETELVQACTNQDEQFN